jgi:predicted flavoprotein YhiN
LINAADELALYAFTTQLLIDFAQVDNYDALTKAGIGGKLYPLTMKAITMYNNLLEILDETACGGKNNITP